MNLLFFKSQMLKIKKDKKEILQLYKNKLQTMFESIMNIID